MRSSEHTNMSHFLRHLATCLIWLTLSDLVAQLDTNLAADVFSSSTRERRHPLLFAHQSCAQTFPTTLDFSVASRNRLSEIVRYITRPFTCLKSLTLMSLHAAIAANAMTRIDVAAMST